jgi:hypothetical protein
MESSGILAIIGLSGLLVLAAGVAVSQEKKVMSPPQPHLFHFWSDAKGETHLEEIKLGNNRRAMIPGVTMNFSVCRRRSARVCCIIRQPVNLQ